MIYFYMSDSNDGWRNLATDRFFLENLHKNDVILYLYVNANAVIIGKSQNAWRECNLGAMESDGVQLVRRHTGGGAVFHDMNNLNFSFIMGEESYDLGRQMGVIEKTVADLGLHAQLSGRNDILIDGKKFSGNAFAHSGAMRAHHGTLLVNTDVTRLSRYLNVSEKKMNAKGIKSVSSRVCNLADFNKSITVKRVTELLKCEFAEEYGKYTEYTFTDEDKEKIQALYDNISSWEWKFGRSLAFDYKLEERFSFGEMQFLFKVKDGEVSDAYVFTDALDTELVDEVRQRLLGVRFTAGSMAKGLRESEREELGEIANYIESVQL